MGDFFIWALLFAIVCMVLKNMKPDSSPPEPAPAPPPSPPPSPDTEYTQSFKDKIAIEALKGKSAEDIISEHPSLKEEEINKWKEELLNNFSRLSESNADLSMRVGQLYMKVQWLEKACKKYIGDDWKDKTGYKYL